MPFVAVVKRQREVMERETMKDRKLGEETKGPGIN